MPKVPKSAKHGRPKKSNTRSETAQLDELIAEATVDCYNESEEITGIFAMLEEKPDGPVRNETAWVRGYGRESRFE